MFEKEIEEFAAFKADWNGYDAEPFSKEVIENAKLFDKYLYYDPDECVPEIFPTAANSLQVEYEKPDMYLEIEITAAGFEVFTSYFGIEEEFVFPKDNLYQVVNIIKLFYRPHVGRAVLFTGAFNPPTVAHYHMIESAVRDGGFDYVVFAISNDSFLQRKQKRKKDYAYSEQDRLNMILAMTHSRKDVLIFGVEKGYTYNVLNAVKAIYGPDELYFALGSDKLKQIEKWGYKEQLLKEFQFYILNRAESVNHTSKKCKEIFKNTRYIIGYDNEKYKNVSATEARRRIKNKEDYSDLVVNEVYEYLQERSKNNDFS